MESKQKRKIKGWRNQYTDRELAEIRYCELYVEEFSHGTDGHLIRSIVAKMVGTLDLLDEDEEGGGE